LLEHREPSRSSASAPTPFRSASDWWLIAIIALAVLVVLSIALIVFVNAGFNWTKLLVVSPGVLIGIGLPLWLLRSTSYLIDGSTLVVRGGPIQVRVPIESISSVERTNTIASAPALSLRRMRIAYGDRSVIISPRDPDAFLAALAGAGMAGTILDSWRANLHRRES
jgi:hypothetical protein